MGVLEICALNAIHAPIKQQPRVENMNDGKDYRFLLDKSESFGRCFPRSEQDIEWGECIPREFGDFENQFEVDGIAIGRSVLTGERVYYHLGEKAFLNAQLWKLTDMASFKSINKKYADAFRFIPCSLITVIGLS